MQDKHKMWIADVNWGNLGLDPELEPELEPPSIQDAASTKINNKPAFRISHEKTSWPTRSYFID